MKIMTIKRSSSNGLKTEPSYSCVEDGSLWLEGETLSAGQSMLHPSSMAMSIGY